MLNNLEDTLVFRVADTENAVRDTLQGVYSALVEKGYDPVNQLVGYLISGDPTYITSHKDARGRIAHLQRDDIVEYLLRYYLHNQKMD